MEVQAFYTRFGWLPQVPRHRSGGHLARKNRLGEVWQIDDDGRTCIYPEPGETNPVVATEVENEADDLRRINIRARAEAFGKPGVTLYCIRCGHEQDRIITTSPAKNYCDTCGCDTWQTLPVDMSMPTTARIRDPKTCDTCARVNSCSIQARLHVSIIEAAEQAMGNKPNDEFGRVTNEWVASCMRTLAENCSSYKEK